MAGQAHPRREQLSLLARAAGGLLLGLFWLLLLGAYARFQMPAAALFAIAVTGVFAAAHVYRGWPQAWRYARLRGFDRAHLAPALATLLLLSAAQIGLLVILGAPQTAASSQPAPGWLLPVIAICAAPLIEEFAFRLWLQSPLETLLPAAMALLLSTLAFTLVHGLETWYSHALSGLLYGGALILSGSIWLPVLLHTVSNAIIAGLDATPGVTDVLRHWSNHTGMLAYGIVAMLLGGAGLMSGYWYRVTARSAAQ